MGDTFVPAEPPGGEDMKERGSVVLTIGFVLTLAILGAIMSWMSFVVSAIDELHLVNDSTYQFMTWFWVYGLPFVLLIGGIMYYLTRLQKRRYEVY